MSPRIKVELASKNKNNWFNKGFKYQFEAKVKLLYRDAESKTEVYRDYGNSICEVKSHYKPYAARRTSGPMYRKNFKYIKRLWHTYPFMKGWLFCKPRALNQ